MFHHSFNQIIILINSNSRLQSLPNYLVGHYKNIVLTRADFANLVNNTPLAKIFQKSSHTKYFLNNISDIIRVVLLWQFGGTYLDSDVISLKPVPDQASHCWHSFNQKTNLVYLTMSQFHTGEIEVAQILKCKRASSEWVREPNCLNWFLKSFSAWVEYHLEFPATSISCVDLVH